MSFHSEGHAITDGENASPAKMRMEFLTRHKMEQDNLLTGTTLAQTLKEAQFFSFPDTKEATANPAASHSRIQKSSKSLTVKMSKKSTNTHTFNQPNY